MEKFPSPRQPTATNAVERAAASSQDYQSERGTPTSASDSTYDEFKASNDGTSAVGSHEETPPAEEEEEEEQQQEVLSSRKKAIIVLALCVCVFLSALDQTISESPPLPPPPHSGAKLISTYLRITVTTAIPAIAEQYKSPTAYTWISSSYLLASAAFLPSWGKISDIWGRKPVLLSAGFIFLVGSILCASAQNVEMLLVGRVIQGLGAGGQLGLVNVTISDLVSVRERGVYLGYVGLTWAFASAIGPVLGGVFTEKATWRLCFWINIPIGIIAMLGLFIFLHLESPKITMAEGLRRVDWLGTFLIVSGTVLFLLGLEFGGVSHPWNSPVVICFLVSGLVLVGAFLFVEWKIAKLPIMPLRLFTHRTNVCSYLVSFFHGMIFIAGCYFIPLYFQSVRGDSALLSGVYVLPYVMILSLVSAFCGLIISKTGRYQEVIWGGCVFMTLGIGLFVNLDRTSGWGKLFIYQALAGIGCGPLFQAPLIAIYSTIDHKDVATATTTFSFIRSLGTALAICIGLVVFQNVIQDQSDRLASVLSPEAVHAISGNSAAASVGYVQALPENERIFAMDAYAKGLSTMWYFFMAAAVICCLASVGIGRHHLSKQVSSLQPAKARKRKATKGEV